MSKSEYIFINAREWLKFITDYNKIPFFNKYKTEGKEKYLNVLLVFAITCSIINKNCH